MAKPLTLVQAASRVLQMEVTVRSQIMERNSKAPIVLRPSFLLSTISSERISRSPFENGGATNLNIVGTGLPSGQFNSIQPGRYPQGLLTQLTGYGPILHVTGQSFFDPTATFQNSNVGGNTSVLFTAHIDYGNLYNNEPSNSGSVSFE